MKTKLLALLFLAGTTVFAGPRVFVGFGVNVGPAYGYYAAPPPPPAPVYVAPAPAPGYAWIGGYYAPYGGRYVWHRGYWARPPYAGAAWVAPRYYGGRYFAGYWRR